MVREVRGVDVELRAMKHWLELVAELSHLVPLPGLRSADRVQTTGNRDRKYALGLLVRNDGHLIYSPWWGSTLSE